jgi:hypothetical protein
MTQSFLRYRLLRVAKHPRCSREDLLQPMHLPRGRHCLQQDSSYLWSRLLASAPIVVSSSAWRPSSPIDGSGLLADDAIVGISTWRAGAAALWIASVEDTTASTYDFHATHYKTNIIM